MRSDPGIDVLLDLDGVVIDQGAGFWIKIDAWRVTPSRDIPHGIRYCLTLHDPQGRRMLGFDNAHAVRAPGRKMYAGQFLPFDHKHRHMSDKGAPYGFESASQLLADFFDAVDRAMQEAIQS